MQALARSTPLRICASPTREASGASASVSASRPAVFLTKDSARSWRLSSAAATSDASACFRAGEFFDNSLASVVPRTASSRSSGGGRRGVVEMKAKTAAAGYAAALLELAQSGGALPATHSDVEKLQSLCENEEFSAFIKNPIILEEKKKAVLKQVAVDGGFQEFTLNFINLLVDKKRISLLSEIVLEFEQLYCETTDMEVAEVTSAIKLENAQQALIAKKLQALTGAKKIKLKNIIDPSLIAGFKVKFGKGGSTLVDLSVKGQLDILEQQFAVSN